MFTAETFQSSFERALKAGAKSWKQLTEQYEWTKMGTNLEDVQKLWPAYSLEWARVQIMRVYNVDPNIYRAIVARLGGCEHKDINNASVQMLKVGARAIEVVGIAEAYRAFREVPRTKFAVLAAKIQGMKGPDDLRKEIDILNADVSAAGRTLGEKVKSEQGRDENLDYRREYWKLTAENEKLRKENVALRSRVNILESKIRSGVAKIREEFNAKIEDLARA